MFLVFFRERRGKRELFTDIEDNNKL